MAVVGKEIASRGVRIVGPIPPGRKVTSSNNPMFNYSTAVKIGLHSHENRIQMGR